MEYDKIIHQLRHFYMENKRLPTYQEICDMFGYASKNAGYYLVNKLIEAGYIKRDEDGKLIPENIGLPLPFLGSIQAGTPTFVEDEIYDSVTFDSYVVNNPLSSFLLRVSGDSMIDAGINEDDLVVIEKTQDLKNGDIVAACIENECTLKYFEKNKNKILLLPANKNYHPIQPTENTIIYGKVVSLIRKYEK